MKSLLDSLIYRAKKAAHGEVILDEGDLDAAIAVIQACALYHQAYSDRRFAPEGSWEAADSSRRMEEAYAAVEAVIANLKGAA